MGAGKRILLAKMGLDCHDTGIITVGQMLRDAGYEVVYLGLHNDADQVVSAAIEEAVDVIGVSFLSGQHNTQVRRLMAAMKDKALTLPVFCGGVIPPDDVETLKQIGVAEVMRTGTLTAVVLGSVEKILNCVRPV
jgi:methylmalonyl-CoA mutase C-terminal domain/subunit